MKRALAALACLSAIVFVQGMPDQVLVKKHQIAEDVPVTSNDAGAVRAQNSPVIAVDPADDGFVALANRWDAPDFHCSLQISGDRGKSWIPVEPVPRLPVGAEKCYAPEIAFDGQGTLYYLFVGLQGTGNNPIGVFLATSPDQGRTFSAPVKILGEGNYQVRMALDPTIGNRGRIHVVWLHTTMPPPRGGLPHPPNPIMAAHSDDGGETFSRPVQVSDPHRRYVVAPVLAVGVDGSVHVVYYDLQDDARDYLGLEGPPWQENWSLISTVSLDGGTTFGASSIVDEQIIPPERVMLIYTMPPASLAAADDDYLCVSWHDARNGDWDVFLKCSDDQGRSWPRSVRVNDDVIRNGSQQYLPRLSVSLDGRLDVIFYDRRRDSDGVRNDVYYTYSEDEGRSFAPNVRINSRSFDSRSGQRYLSPSAQGLVEFGSRLALHSWDTGILAAWTDTRNAQFSPYQDIFAGTVHLPVARRGNHLWVGIGLLAAVALLVVILVLRYPGRPGATLCLAIILVSNSCAREARRADRWPPRPATVRVIMKEYAFDHPRSLPPGRGVFSVVNEGKLEHEMVVMALPDDVAPLAQQVRSDRSRTYPVLFHSPTVRPREEGRFALDLSPGRYGIVCFLETPNGEAHLFKGMTSEFRVQ